MLILRERFLKGVIMAGTDKKIKNELSKLEKYIAQNQNDPNIEFLKKMHQVSTIASGSILSVSLLSKEEKDKLAILLAMANARLPPPGDDAKLQALLNEYNNLPKTPKSVSRYLFQAVFAFATGVKTEQANAESMLDQAKVEFEKQAAAAPKPASTPEEKNKAEIEAKKAEVEAKKAQIAAKEAEIVAKKAEIVAKKAEIAEKKEKVLQIGKKYNTTDIKSIELMRQLLIDEMKEPGKQGIHKDKVLAMSHDIDELKKLNKSIKTCESQLNKLGRELVALTTSLKTLVSNLIQSEKELGGLNKSLKKAEAEVVKDKKTPDEPKKKKQDDDKKPVSGATYWDVAQAMMGRLEDAAKGRRQDAASVATKTMKLAVTPITVPGKYIMSCLPNSQTRTAKLLKENDERKAREAEAKTEKAAKTQVLDKTKEEEQKVGLRPG